MANYLIILLRKKIVLKRREQAKKKRQQSDLSALHDTLQNIYTRVQVLIWLYLYADYNRQYFLVIVATSIIVDVIFKENMFVLNNKYLGECSMRMNVHRCGKPPTYSVENLFPNNSMRSHDQNESNFVCSNRVNQVIIISFLFFTTTHYPIYGQNSIQYCLKHSLLSFFFSLSSGHVHKFHACVDKWALKKKNNQFSIYN